MFSWQGTSCDHASNDSREAKVEVICSCSNAAKSLKSGWHFMFLRWVGWSVQKPDKGSTHCVKSFQQLELQKQRLDQQIFVKLCQITITKQDSQYIDTGTFITQAIGICMIVSQASVDLWSSTCERNALFCLRLVGPSYYLMDCCDIFYRYSWSPEDKVD